MLRAVQMAGLLLLPQIHHDRSAQCLRDRTTLAESCMSRATFTFTQAVEAALPPCGPGGRSIKPKRVIAEL